MTAAMTGALSTWQMGRVWSTIDWDKVTAHVYRLQVRIAKAIALGKYHKAQSLQWLLVRSHFAKLLAVKRVTESQGSKTVGVDGVTWKSASARYQGACSLRARGYRAQPLRRIYIPKRNGKRRPLSIPTMYDRAMQALYLLALLPVAETTGDLHSYGFRLERSAQDACQHCYIALAQKRAAQWILDADIEGCFDNISHEWLLKHIPLEKRMLRQWLNSGFIEKQSFERTIAGVPQGGVISPVLSNMVLDGLQQAIRRSHVLRDKVNFIRYADDFVVTADSPQVLHDKVIPVIKTFLAERGLRLSPEKTKVVHIEDGFDFLGFTIRKYNGKYLSRPSRDSVKSLLSNTKQVIKKGYGLSGACVIQMLNRKIKGWGNYFRCAASKATFAKIDSIIYKQCLHWVLRKYGYSHRHKAAAKYFHRRSESRSWIFSDLKVNKKGIVELVAIAKMMDVKIQRHVKIRSVANPFDPDYWDYFEQRKLWKQSVNDRQRKAYQRIYARMQSMLQAGRHRL